jgi:uncharacterized protein YgbK (DUF1537 family)
LIVGTAGLAEFLTEALNLKKQRSVLSIIGSVSDVTRDQIEYAKKSNNLVTLNYSFKTMLNEDLDKAFAEGVIEALAMGQDVVVQTAASLSDVKEAEALGKSKGMNTFEVSEFIADKLGAMTALVFKKASEYLNGIFITGGDTLIKIATKLGVEGMAIQEEVLPAIPNGRFISKEYDKINVVTKAGGFGKPEAFAEILKYLKNN